MRPLQRPDRSAAEIADLPTLGTTQCLAYVRDHGSALAPETLVYLLREASNLKDTPLFEMCGRLLLGQGTPTGGWRGGHCEATIASLSYAYGFSGDINLRRAFRTGCLDAAFIAIHAGREKKPFWEERFGRAFKASCIDVARSLQSPRSRAREADVASDTQHDVDVDGVDSGEPRADDTILTALARPRHEAEILAAVRGLPRRQAQAVVLRWMEGRSIEGDGDDTVAAIMGITPRAVYAHLNKAAAILSANPTLRRIWQGEV